MPFLLLLALAGFTEFWFMLVVAGHIGAFATVLLTIATAVIGFGLMQRQGLATLARAREKMDQGQSPAREMIEGVALFVGGCLLLLPGFITDALGLLLMLPGIRGVLAKRFIGPVSRVRMGGFSFRQGPGATSGDTFEGQYERTDQANNADTKKNQNFLP